MSILKQYIFQLIEEKLSESDSTQYTHHAHLVDDHIHGLGKTKEASFKQASANINREHGRTSYVATGMVSDLKHDLEHNGHYNVTKKAHDYIHHDLRGGDTREPADAHDDHLSYDHEKRTIKLKDE